MSRLITADSLTTQLNVRKFKNLYLNLNVVGIFFIAGNMYSMVIRDSVFKDTYGTFSLFYLTT